MRTKNLYFTGDLVLNEDADTEEALNACFLELKTMDSEHRLLFAAVEDGERLEKLSDEFNREGDAEDFIDFAEELFEGYNRRCDIIFLHGNVCHYHIPVRASLMLVRKTKHVVLKQDNWFLSEDYPFWSKTGIKAGDLILYGDDINKDEITISHAYCLFLYNKLMEKGGGIHMSYKEMLRCIGYEKGCYTSMIGVNRI